MHKAKLSSIPLMALLPNIMTMFGLCLGTTAVKYALEGKFDVAAALIIIASIVDGMDGRLARLLNKASRFGAQLDSLADLVSFGVAPAIVAYLWSLHNLDYNSIGWAAALFYIACSALRLARFNVQATEPSKNHNFFTGIPTPAGAALILLPLMITFNIPDLEISPYYIASHVCVVGLMMISRVPTFSGKRVNIKKRYVAPLLIFAGLVMAVILIEPWAMLSLIWSVYAFSIPLSVFFYYKYKDSDKRGKE